MREVYAGDTPDFLLNIKDETGTIIDVTDSDKVENVIIVAYSLFDPGKVLGSFALDPSLDYSNHTQLTTQNGSVKLILPAEGTEKCVNEEVVVQIRTIFVDSSYPTTGLKILTAADVICKIIAYKE